MLYIASQQGGVTMQWVWCCICDQRDWR